MFLKKSFNKLQNEIWLLLDIDHEYNAQQLSLSRLTSWRI